MLIHLMLAPLAAATVNYTGLIDCLNGVPNVESFSLNSDQEEITFVGNNQSTVDMYDQISSCYDEQGVSKRYVLMTANGRYTFIDAGHVDEHDANKQEYSSAIDPADYTKYFQPVEVEDASDSGDLTSYGWTSAKLTMRQQNDQKCKSRGKVTCNHNFNLGQCVSFDAPVLAGNSVGYDNTAGHEHQVMIWPHHSCRSKSVQDPDNPKKHVEGVVVTLHSGKNKCLANRAVLSWWVKPNKHTAWPNKDQGLSNMLHATSCR